MQTAVTNQNTTPLVPKNLNDTQVELQRQIDKLNSNVAKGKDHEKILTKINAINENIALVQAEHDKERKSMTTWGMAPKTWKYIGGSATVITALADIAAITSNIPLTVLVENTTMTIIVTTSVTGGIGILAAGLLGVFTYGQIKAEKRLDAFDQKARQNELMSIFLSSYQAFMDNTGNKSHDSLETQVKELKECVELLKNISPSTLPQEAKDHWLSAMIEKLPDNDERKKRLLDQRKLAEAIEKDGILKEIVTQDASSEQPEFLKTTRADQAADLNLNTSSADFLRSQYDANLQALRDEFGMDIQEMHVGGYKFNSKYTLKKQKKFMGNQALSVI